jgi:hypothetical protein
MHGGTIGPAGDLGLALIKASGARIPVAGPRPWPLRPVTMRDVLEHGAPQKGMAAEVNEWRLRNLRHLWRGLRRVGLARSLRLPTFYGQLWLSVIRADGQVVDLGLASLRVVTTAGVNFIVDAFQGTVEPEILKFHGIGTTNTAEASSDTALAAESTTALNPDNTRATGSLTEGASANIFRTVGTLTADATIAAVEHGIFSQAATGGGTLLDRSVFSTVTLASADSLQATYDLTFTAGS